MDALRSLWHLPRQGLGIVLEQCATEQLRIADLEAGQQVGRLDIELLHAVMAYQYAGALVHQFGECFLVIRMFLGVLAGSEKDAAFIQPDRQGVSSAALQFGKMKYVANAPCRIAR